MKLNDNKKRVLIEIFLDICVTSNTKPWLDNVLEKVNTESGGTGTSLYTIKSTDLIKFKEALEKEGPNVLPKSEKAKLRNCLLYLLSQRVNTSVETIITEWLQHKDHRDQLVNQNILKLNINELKRDRKDASLLLELCNKLSSNMMRVERAVYRIFQVTGKTSITKSRYIEESKKSSTAATRDNSKTIVPKQKEEKDNSDTININAGKEKNILNEKSKSLSGTKLQTKHSSSKFTSKKKVKKKDFEEHVLDIDSQQLSLNEDVYTLEVKVILHNPSFKNDDVECFIYHQIEEGKEYVPLTLQKDGTFAVKLMCPSNKRTFVYKYFIKTKKDSNMHWENFCNHPGLDYINRSVQLTQDQINRKHFTQYDFAFMEYAPGYIEVALDFLAFHLNSISSEEPCTLMSLLWDWLSTVFVGWSYDTNYRKSFEVDLMKIEAIFARWLHQLNIPGMNGFKILIAALTYANFIKLHHFPIHRGPHYAVICKSLEITNLPQDNLTVLYASLLSVDVKKSNTSFILDCEKSIMYLINNGINHMSNWVHLLPLYWLIKGEGKILSPIYNYETLTSASRLPVKSIFTNPNFPNPLHENTQLQEYIWNLVQEGQIFISSFGHLFKPLLLHVMKMESLIQMICHFKCVPSCFPIDMVLCKIKNEEQIYSFEWTNVVLHPIIQSVGKELFGYKELLRNDPEPVCQKILNCIEFNENILEKWPVFQQPEFIVLELPIQVSSMLITFLEEFQPMATNKLSSIKQKKWKRHLDPDIHFQKTTNFIRKKLQDNFKFDGKEIVEIFNTLLKINFFCDKQIVWNKMVEEELKNIIEKKWQNCETDLIDEYVMNISSMKMNDIVKKCFEMKVFHVLEKELEAQTYWAKLTDLITGSGSVLIDVVDKLFMKEYENLKHRFHFGNDDITENFAINFVLQCSFGGRYFILSNKVNLKCNPNVSKILMELRKVLLSICENFEKRQISIQHLSKVITKHEVFLEIFSFLKVKTNNDLSWKNIFDSRKNELQLCNNFIKALEFFEYLLKNYSPKLTFVWTFPYGENLDEQKLSSLVTVKNNEDTGVETTISWITMQDLNLLYILKDTHAVRSVWKHKSLESSKHDNSFKQQQFSLKFATESIWNPTKHILLKFIQHIDNGTIFVSEIEKYFGSGTVNEQLNQLTSLNQFYKKFLDSDANEKYKYKPLVNLGQRKKQLRAVFRSNGLKNTADLLYSIVKKFQLEGDFEEIQQILQINKTSGQNLGDISDSRIVDKDFLSGFKENEIKVIKLFLEEEQLIDYLLPMGDFREVQVMCDMAIISVGENEMDVDKISSLLTAVVGFSPLLYDHTEITGLENLVSKCHQVWENAQKDKNLVKKWSDCANHLPWFKKIKGLHGSVESDSIKLAQDINSYGRYKIFCENDLNLAAAIKVEIKQNESQKIIDHSTLEQLRSKLMLISSDNEMIKNDIEQFVELYKSVEILAAAYVNLKTAGCVLFNEWKIDILTKHSNFNRHMSNQQKMVLYISFGSNFRIIPVTNASIKDVNILTKILTATYDKWSGYMDKIRNEYYYINYYNIQQITFLCQSLGHCMVSSTFSDQLFVLLSKVVNSITKDNINKALHKANSKCNKSKSTCEDHDKFSNTDGEVDEDKLSRNSRMDLLKSLIKDNCPEILAKAAVQANPNLDKDDCEIWISQNDKSFEKISKLSYDFDCELELNNSLSLKKALNISSDEENLQNAINKLCGGLDNNHADALPLIENLIEMFSCKTTTMIDNHFISFEVLGEMLNYLHCSTANNKVCYDLPPLFKKGQPNIIVIPENRMLAFVLSLYENSSNHPLPSSQEILLCSEDTTSSTVELFLRRAVCSSQGRIYCMVFAEKLCFNVSQAAEKLFENLSNLNCSSSEYQLVIFTSSQTHYLTSCFEKYILGTMCLANENTLTEYLSSHLQSSLESNIFQNSYRRNNVQIVFSEHPAVGKSLYINRLKEKYNKVYKNNTHYSTVIRLVENNVDKDNIVKLLYEQAQPICLHIPHFIHIDVTPSVKTGLDTVLFDLLILGYLEDSNGKVWKRCSTHLYFIELTKTNKAILQQSTFLHFLPDIKCIPPKEVMEHLTNSLNKSENILLADTGIFNTELIQRPYLYLNSYEKKKNMDDITYNGTKKCSSRVCLETLLKFFPSSNPTWSQLINFTSFLNVQLRDCERSVFCDKYLVGKDSGLIGLKQMVVTSIIRMAQDFCSPSLNISDESFTQETLQSNDDFQNHQLRRKWETEPHPYIFFNRDGNSMTFLNFVVDKKSGNIVDKHGNVIAKMPNLQLTENLMYKYGVDLNMDLNNRNRRTKLEILCKIMGVVEYDPDPSFELTSDNVLKILAIYMRFKSNIPVILIGETGCGKTRMMEFISKLYNGPNKKENSMFTLKVHGGITPHHIHKLIQQFITKKSNDDNTGIVFFDEANTTEAIYAIKEILCDMSINGKDIRNDFIKFVAACNPYKRLSDKAIQDLIDSGLGYRVKDEDTINKLGNIPLRKLVYRVVSLPPSMQPLAWDFGELSSHSEGKYIEQMCQQFEVKCKLSLQDRTFVSTVLKSTQKFMRKCKDECHYVSMRDIERFIIIFHWFWGMYDRKSFLDKFKNNLESHLSALSKVVHCLLFTLNVCYFSSLHDRQPYLKVLSCTLKNHKILISESEILMVFKSCQDVFVNQLRKDENIAFNEALRENVFMMTVCLDNRIPLFLIGKPGSSKSLSKTIVGDNMQGLSSQSELYKELKRVHIITFQCSGLTDAVGIENVFKQCIQLQNKQDLDHYTSVVVLDEIGLAEDSHNMPLKILHPLLETGSTKNSTLSDVDTHQKVAFIGISNWALDPAKMNRGIFVTRSKPKREDLIETSEAIFDKKDLFRPNKEILEVLTDTYLSIYTQQEVEFFGLRDYYGLIKMVYRSLKKSKKSKAEKQNMINFKNALKAVQRNFSGGKKCYLSIFQKSLLDLYKDELPHLIPLKQLILDNLKQDQDRFLLLITSQYSALNILSFLLEGKYEFEVIFGSSFEGDHNYSEICRNINKIKTCMEIGRMVVLLNLSDLYESLYDTLNQHYVVFGGQHYVDIGLGGHRLKCRVSRNFKLIVIEDKKIVYDEFPIPLINRLEKYCLDSQGLLDEQKKKVAISIEKWAGEFSFGSPSEVFIGYHKDILYTIVMNCSTVQEGVLLLLQSATMDSIHRSSSDFLNINYQDEYTNNQTHDTLVNCLYHQIKECKENSLKMIEVKSFSSLLTYQDRTEIEGKLQLQKNFVILLTLQQFYTQSELSSKIMEFKKQRMVDNQSCSVILIQCQAVEKHYKIYDSMKYTVTNLVKGKPLTGKLIVVFIALTSRITDYTSKFVAPFSSDCLSVFVDELKITHLPLICSNTKTSLFWSINQWSLNLPFFSQLLINCIPTAVSKVIFNEKKRELFHIQYLSEKINSNYNDPFVRILFERILKIIYTRENCFKDKSANWISLLADDVKLLEENGVFQASMWMYVKDVLSKVLAYIISECDAYNNCRFINERDWKHNMWLDILWNDSILQLPWTEKQEQINKFTVSNFENQRTFSCKCPFSFLISLVIENKRMKILQVSNTFDNNLCLLIQKSFDENGLTNILTKYLALSNGEILFFYVYDIVKMAFVKQTEEEINLFSYIIECFLMNEKAQDQKWTTIDIIKSNFHLFSLFDILGLLSKLVSKFPTIPKLFIDHLSQEMINSSSILLESATKVLLNYLIEEVILIKDSNECNEWLTTVKDVRHSINQFLDKINNDELKKSFTKQWKNILFVYNFLYEILPLTVLRDKIVGIVAPRARLMWKNLQLSDIDSYAFTKVFLSALKKSCNELKTLLLTEWETKTCCVCKHNLLNPIKYPCSHYICQDCVMPDFQRCPNCNEKLNENCTYSICRLTETDNSIYESFKENCTSAFMNYISNSIFLSESKIQMEIQNLIGSVAATIDENINKYFDDAVDFTMLNWNYSRVSIFLGLVISNEHYRTILDRILVSFSSSSLLMILTYALEQRLDNQFEISTTSWNEKFKTTCKIYANSSNERPCINLLYSVSFIRYMLYLFVKEFKDPEIATQNNNFTLMIENLTESLLFFENSELLYYLQKYFILIGFNLYGSNWCKQIVKKNEVLSLIPLTLCESDLESNIDYFVLFGDDYLLPKNNLYQSSVNNIESTVSELLTSSDDQYLSCVNNIAVFRWAFDIPVHHKAFVKNFHDVNNFVSMYPVILKSCNADVVEANLLKDVLILIHFAVITCSTTIMKEFSELYVDPNSINVKYIPGMPLSRYFNISKALQCHKESNAVYQCPNGHLYTIGDCGRPYVISSCSTCGAAIGGQNHESIDGNKRVSFEENSQTGYKLHQENDINMEPAKERIPQEAVSVIQLLIHSVLLLSANENKKFETYRNILHIDHNVNVSEYLVKKILVNITQLQDALNINRDNTFLFIHVLLKAFIECKGTLSLHWTDISTRAQWEQQFYRNYIRPHVKNINDTIHELSQVVEKGNADCNVKLYALLNEKETEEELNFWQYRVHLTEGHFRRYLQNQDESPDLIISQILSSQNLLYLRHLFSFLKLQKSLIKRYNYKLNPTEGVELSFEKYLEETENENKSVIEDYINLCNKLAPVIFQGSNLPSKLSTKSSILYGLPNSRSLGKFAKKFIEYLLKLQNDFLEKSACACKDFLNIEETDVSDVLQSDICDIQMERDIQPLIDRNTIYKIIKTDKGTKHDIKYNLQAIEKMVIENIVGTKRKIKLSSLPCVKYSQEVGINISIDEFSTKQRFLSNTLANEIDRQVQDFSLQDICEVLNTMTIVLGFLAKDDNNIEIKLLDYFEKELLLNKSQYRIIPYACELQDAVGMYLRLSWHRSVFYTKSNKNPFEETLNMDEQVPLNENLISSLQKFLANTDVKRFQHNLNESILKAGMLGLLSPEWSLSLEIIPDLDTMANLFDEEIKWLDNFPEEICFKHIWDVFKFTVMFIEG